MLRIRLNEILLFEIKTLVDVQLPNTSWSGGIERITSKHRTFSDYSELINYAAGNEAETTFTEFISMIFHKKSDRSIYQV